MSGDRDKDKKDFSGLADLTSDVNDIDDVASPEPVSPPPRPSPPTSKPAESNETERKASDTDDVASPKPSSPPPRPSQSTSKPSPLPPKPSPSPPKPSQPKSTSTANTKTKRNSSGSPRPIEKDGSGRRSGSSGIKWALGIFAAIFFVAWVANNGTQKSEETSYSPPPPSQTFNSPQGSSPPVSTFGAVTLNEKAEKLLKSGKYSEGLKILNKAVEVDPGYAVAYYNRGLTYCHLKQYSKAIEDYDKAIELYPNYVFAYSMRGWTYSRLKQYSRAIKDYDNAIDLNPSYAVAYYNRGLAYISWGRINQGCADLKKACNLGDCKGLEWATKKGKCQTKRGKLFVKTDQKNSRVRILNIKPKFYQGMVLDPGRYHVEVSNPDYKTKKIWVKLEAGENKRLEIKLVQLQTSIQPTYTPPSSTPNVIKRDGIYVAYANGIVKDTDTGLEWKAGPDEDTNWNEAKSWVQSLKNDSGGWKMPTIGELKTLYMKGSGTYNMTPFLKMSGGWVWSGETKNSSSAWCLNFGTGLEFLTDRSYSGHERAFAVRSRSDG